MPKWSKLKKSVESLFAEKVRGRVELRAVGYHHAHDGDGRGYITIDGVEIASFCSFVAFRTQWELTRGANLTAELYESVADEGVARGLDTLANEKRIAEGVLKNSEYFGFLHDYLSISHSEALESNNIIFLAMAILDRRLGKRRIPGLGDRYQAHPLLKRLYAFRCEVEGVVPRVKPQPA